LERVGLSWVTPPTIAILSREWASAMPSLGAQLLADALEAGLADDPLLLDSLLAVYQSTFRSRTMPIFEYTLKAASLKDPASAVPIYQRIAKSDPETTRFMDVLAGNIPFKEFFNPQNIQRLLA
jgi:hypothetical protein